ncbi:hypothetical protein DFQ28_009911 [Apophysomyces sp. BC1034]|nr:hypothetical protein DFQ30_006901 [Apophysomyces sp. BC1015]KAG0172327.1 hypothetical protein DFQ29_008420 [Apophysomyces sp. BC1021]KAG0185121.1 hypothetical protein DFQ28_009911 [Apophysomyces sp. BC1034]
MTEQTKTLDDLQLTHTVLQKNVSKPQNNTKAALAFTLLGDLIDECIQDVLFEAHRDIKQSNAICQICQTRCRSYVAQPGFDIFGSSYNVGNLPSYDCVNCHKTIAASRYAPHLEKCLGLAGRQSSRVATRRLGSSPIPSNSSDDNLGSISDPDNSYSSDRKRKKLMSAVNGVSRVKKLKSLGND